MLQKGTKAPHFEGIIETGERVSLADTDMTILKAYEAWGEKKNYGKVTMGTLRTTYVIDEKGIIVDAIGKVDTKNHTAQIL